MWKRKTGTSKVHEVPWFQGVERNTSLTEFLILVEVCGGSGGMGHGSQVPP